MQTELRDIHLQVSRQLAHWILAGQRLANLSDLAAAEAWESLERYLNTAIRARLRESLDLLSIRGEELNAQLQQTRSLSAYKALQKEVDAYRKQYLRTETVLDFYADAINTRTSSHMAIMLSACDRMAKRSMDRLLIPLGKESPAVLTYIDKGLGASILKAGLRLWDRETENPAAVIKVVRHNLLRPTSLIHEAGHQVAHILGWNEELRFWLRQVLKSISSEVAEIWASWASEIAADVFGFVHTGYASVASLHDVVSGNDQWVFRFMPGDPHPISFLRVLMGIACCKMSYGKGPWDPMAKVWMAKHPIRQADFDMQRILRLSIKALPKIVKLCLHQPMEALGGKALARHISPKEVSPDALRELEHNLGPDLAGSQYWAQQAPLKLLALSGYRIATEPHRIKTLLEQQQQWMQMLGGGRVRS